MVSLFPVPFPMAMVLMVCFFIMVWSLVLNSVGLWRNALSNHSGFQSWSRMASLHPDRYPGSMARMVFPYSGLVMRSFPRFFWKLSMASFSPISESWDRISFSTDSNKAVYPCLNAVSRWGVCGRDILRIFVY